MFASISGMAQVKLFTEERASDEEYKIVIDYLRKNEGRRVGDGNCKTLIDSAIFAYSGVPSFMKIVAHTKTYDMGEKIVEDVSEIEKGDVLLINGAYDANDESKTEIHHIAFVRRVIDGDKLAITDQNPNPVKSTVIDFNDLIGGEVFIFKIIPKKQLQRAYTKLFTTH